MLFQGEDDEALNEEESIERVMKRQKEAFAIHSQERIMGLLGAIIPPENKVVWVSRWID